MQPLNEAIATVLREVERGLAAQRAMGGLPLVPEHIRLTLNFALEATGPTVPAESAGPHAVTLEFRVGEAGQLPPAPSLAPPVTRLPVETGIVPVLTQLFGAPGFDSSARATVFRETLEGRSHEEALVALAALGSAATPPKDHETRRISQVLRGIIHSGPTKNVAQGAALLATLMSDYPLAEVLRVAETQWKTHDDWLGEQ